MENKATVFSSPCSKKCNKKSREEMIAIAINETQNDLDATDLIDLRRQLEEAPINEVESFCRDVLGLSIEREPGEWSLSDAFFTTGVASECPRPGECARAECDLFSPDRAPCARLALEQEIGRVVVDLDKIRHEIAKLTNDRKAIDERLRAARAKAVAARKRRDLLLHDAVHDGF